MQDALSAQNKCTYILVKIKDGADVDTVAARIEQALPGNKINLTRNLVIDAQDRIPGLKTFLRVLVGLGAFVSDDLRFAFDVHDDHRTPQRDRHLKIARRVEIFHYQSHRRRSVFDRSFGNYFRIFRFISRRIYHSKSI